jgi:hypothetical protein
MKTEKELKELLASKKKTYTETKRRFIKYDNVDDMRYLDVLEAEIALLKGILGKV